MAVGWVMREPESVSVAKACGSRSDDATRTARVAQRDGGTRLQVGASWLQRPAGAGGHFETRSEGLDGRTRRAYDHAMVDAAHISQQTIDAAVDEAIAAVLSGDLASEPHLARAVIAERISAVAHHRSRDEVSAACDVDGASWEEIGHAFGMSPKNAHEHFGTKPSGLPQ